MKENDDTFGVNDKPSVPTDNQLRQASGGVSLTTEQCAKVGDAAMSIIASKATSFEAPGGQEEKDNMLEKLRTMKK